MRRSIATAVALCWPPSDLLWNKEVRVILEQGADNFAAQVYRDRCLSLHRQRSEFDPRPVSEALPGPLDHGEEIQSTAELAKLEVLEQKLTALALAQKEQRTLLAIVFVALAVLTWLSH